jgi:hypothetical protein
MARQHPLKKYTSLTISDFWGDFLSLKTLYVLCGKNIRLYSSSFWMDDIAEIFPILEKYCSILDQSM